MLPIVVSVIYLFIISSDIATLDAIPIDDLKCSFEDGFCRWTNDSLWERDQYSYQIPLTGPRKDGGKDGDFYVHTFPMTTQNNEEVAVLESESITSNTNTGGKTCFRFWYYMYGAYILNLTVTTDSDQILVAEGDQGKGWHCKIFDVTSVTGKIAFHAYRTIEILSVIAIDHIEIIHSSTCSQDICETINNPVVTTDSSLPSQSSVLISTTTSESASPSPGLGVIDLLPIAIGVPCGVLLVGAAIVGICIYRRRHSKEFVNRREELKRPATNIYSGSPRQSENIISGVYEEEVYHELDESEMVGNGYIDPVPYDEIGEVNLRNDSAVRYINENISRSSSNDYLTPLSDRSDGEIRHSSEDYLNAVQFDNAGFEEDGRPQSSDYIEPNRGIVSNNRPDSDDYLELEKNIEKY